MNTFDKKEKLSAEDCSEWSQEQWEEYASSLEVEQREQTFQQETLNYLSDANRNIFFLLNLVNDERSYSNLKKSIETCLFQLTDKQRKIICSIFWENKTQLEIAEELNVCQTAISKTYKRALKKLEKTLTLKQVEKDLEEINKIKALEERISSNGRKRQEMSPNSHKN